MVAVRGRSKTSASFYIANTFQKRKNKNYRLEKQLLCASNIAIRDVDARFLYDAATEM